MAKKLLFDLANTSTSTPIVVPGVFHNAIASSNTIENISRVLNAKDKVKIGSHNLGNIFATASCDPTNGGEGTLSNKDVTVCNLDIYTKWCQATFEQSFLSDKLVPGSNINDFMPIDFYNYLGDALAKKAKATIETMLWQGDAENVASVYPNTLCDGLILQFNADAGVIDIAKATITSSNVYAQLGAVLAALPPTIDATNEDLRLFVSPNVANAYIVAQSLTTGGIFVTGKKELNYNGIPMIISTGLPANNMVLTLKTNIFFITDLVEDFQDVTFIPQFDKSGKHQIIGSANLKAAFSYVNPTEIVFYH